MVLVTPKGTVGRISVLSFSEPEDYLPRKRWLDQFTRRPLADDLSVSGGTSPYTYLWSTGEQIQDVARVAPGTYSVMITDASDCTLTKEIVVNSTIPLTCAITPLSQSPVCLSSNNKVFAHNSDSTMYQWLISSTDGSWHIQAGSNSDTLVYTAGNPNTSATFNLTITKNGCSQSCSYTSTACTSSTGTGGGNNETCNDCFKSTIIKTSDGESCASYKVTISTDGNCRYDLSHFVVAIPCGELSDYSDSGNWPLVIGAIETMKDFIPRIGTKKRSLRMGSDGRGWQRIECGIGGAGVVPGSRETKHRSLGVIP